MRNRDRSSILSKHVLLSITGALIHQTKDELGSGRMSAQEFFLICQARRESQKI